MMLKAAKLGIILAIAVYVSGCRNANSLAREGFKYLEQGKKITALKYFEEALDANKKKPLALYGKGKIMTESALTMNLGQKLIESALPKLEKEYKPDAVKSLAKSYAMENLYSKAIKVLENALTDGIHDPGIYLDLSFYTGQILERSKARNILRKGIEMNPDASSLYLALSDIDIKQSRDFALALKSLEKARQLDPENMEILQKTAFVYYNLGNLDKSIEMLNLLKSIQTNSTEKLMIDKWITQVKSRKWQINL